MWSQIINVAVRLKRLDEPGLTYRYEGIMPIRVPLCPSHALLLALRLSASTPDGPLFTFQGRVDWLPLTAAAFDQMLQCLLASLIVNPSLYSGHSFRRGGGARLLRSSVASRLS